MLHVAALTRVARIGPSPSGKAPGFGPGIRGFESLHPSQDKMFILNALSWLFIFIKKGVALFFKVCYN